MTQLTTDDVHHWPQLQDHQFSKKCQATELQQCSSLVLYTTHEPECCFSHCYISKNNSSFSTCTAFFLQVEQLAPDHATGWWLRPRCNASQQKSAVTGISAFQAPPAPAKLPYTPAGVHRLGIKLCRLEIRLLRTRVPCSRRVKGHTTSRTRPGLTHAAPPHPSTQPGRGAGRDAR